MPSTLSMKIWLLQRQDRRPLRQHLSTSNPKIGQQFHRMRLERNKTLNISCRWKWFDKPIKSNHPNTTLVLYLTIVDCWKWTSTMIVSSALYLWINKNKHFLTEKWRTIGVATPHSLLRGGSNARCYHFSVFCVFFFSSLREDDVCVVLWARCSYIDRIGWKWGIFWWRILFCYKSLEIISHPAIMKRCSGWCWQDKNISKWRTLC